MFMRGYGYTRATTGLQGCSKVALGGHLGVYAAGGTLEDSWSKIPRAPPRYNTGHSGTTGHSWEDLALFSDRFSQLTRQGLRKITTGPTRITIGHLVTCGGPKSYHRSLSHLKIT